MELNKIRNLSDEELKTEADKASEQLFRLKFQRSLGNNEGTKKLGILKQDIARMKTIARERQLGVRGASTVTESAAPAKKAAKKPAKKAAKD